MDLANLISNISNGQTGYFRLVRVFSGRVGQFLVKPHIIRGIHHKHFQLV